MKYITPLILTVSSLNAQDFQLDFNTHLNMVGGASSIHEEELAAHAHDANDEFTLQGLETNASARYGDHLAGFASYNSFLGEDDKIDGELEEAFLKLKELPLGFELRGGRFLNRVTSQNSQHLHAWHFADANLITSRFLGEEGLITNSVELSYKLPFEHNSLLSVGFGDAIAHDDHGHGHGGPHDPNDVEGEGAFLQDDIISARVQGVYQQSDFRQFTYGLSFLNGTNEYMLDTNVFGADLTFLWRENGLETGGKHLRATLEPIYREFDYNSENGMNPGTANEFGLHTSIGWGFTENWELGLRYDYLEGVADPVEGLGQRTRSTVALTREVTYNDYLGSHIRLQYNNDQGDAIGNENSIWLQWQIDLGKGGEIR